MLIGSITLYVGYRYAYDYWHKKEVYHPDRVERLALGEREARLKYASLLLAWSKEKKVAGSKTFAFVRQQLKWAKEAEKMHEETRGREQQALRKRNLKKFDSSQHKVKKGKDEWEEEADWLKGYKGLSCTVAGWC